MLFLKPLGLSVKIVSWACDYDVVTHPMLASLSGSVIGLLRVLPVEETDAGFKELVVKRRRCYRRVRQQSLNPS